MNRAALLVTTILFLSACGPPPAPESGAGGGTFFEGGRAILGNGTEPIEDVAFVVEEGIITAIGPVGEIEHPAGAARYDLSDHTALPFLHNLHGHVGYIDGTNFSAENYSRENVLEDLDRYLYYGVGSVAVLGSDVGDIAFQIREEQRNGQLETARLLTAGHGVTGRNGFPTRIEALADVLLSVLHPHDLGQPLELVLEIPCRREAKVVHLRSCGLPDGWRALRRLRGRRG